MLNASSLFRNGLVACSVLASCLTAASADDSVPWVANIEAARQLSAQHQLPVLVHFWTEDCLPCRIVERDVFSQPPVGSALQQMCIPVKVNAREFPQLAQELGVDRWPTDVMLAPDGRILGKTVSPQKPEDYMSRMVQMLGQLPGQQLPVQQLTGQAAHVASNVAAQVWPAAHQGGQPLGSFQTPVASNAVVSNGEPASQDAMLPPTGTYRAAGPPPTVGPPQGYPPGFANAAPYGPNSGQGYPQGPSQPAFPHAPNSYGHDQPASNSPAALEATATDPQMVDNPYARTQVDAPRPPAMSTPAGTYYGSHQAIGQPAAAPANVAPQQSPAGYASSPSGYPQMPAAVAAYANTPPAAPNTGWGYGPGAATASTPTSGPPNASGNSVAMEPTNSSPAAEKPFCMDGYCPVTLADERRWAEGDPRWGAVHRGRTYLFVSEQARQRFMADPDSFSPMLAGFDPVAYVEDGVAQEGERAHGLVFRNQIFLFASEEHLNRFWQNPDRYEGMVLQAMGGTKPGEERIVR